MVNLDYNSDCSTLWSFTDLDFSQDVRNNTVSFLKGLLFIDSPGKGLVSGDKEDHMEEASEDLDAKYDEDSEEADDEEFDDDDEEFDDDDEEFDDDDEEFDDDDEEYDDDDEYDDDEEYDDDDEEYDDDDEFDDEE